MLLSDNIIRIYFIINNGVVYLYLTLICITSTPPVQAFTGGAGSKISGLNNLNFQNIEKKIWQYESAYDCQTGNIWGLIPSIVYTKNLDVAQRLTV